MTQPDKFRPDPATSATPPVSKQKEDKLLDKALEDSFPASDPSSVTRAPAEKRTQPAKTNDVQKGSRKG